MRAGKGEQFIPDRIVGAIPFDGESFFAFLGMSGQSSERETISLDFAAISFDEVNR